MKHVYCRILDCDFNEHMKNFASIIVNQLFAIAIASNLTDTIHCETATSARRRSGTAS